MKARVFNIMQYEKHPVTGADLINEHQIQVGLAHKTIKRYAYICHDADVYSLKDEADDTDGIKKAGAPKPRHWHIVLECPNQVELSAIAKWFNIPENFIDIPKGVGAFLDCVEYLTHEAEEQQKLGKTFYTDDKVVASFDFRTELLKRDERRAKYGKDLDKVKGMLYDVMYEGKTLRQCIIEDKLVYMDNMERLKRCRMDYIGRMRPPATRINYYVTGRGGVGKGLICRALARNLFPQYTDDEDIFFEVGAKGSAFEGYDGQPVIIWNDRRAIDLLQELNGRGNVFNVFDTHPTKQKQNIKYGSINLCNVVNIVNSVQPYDEFLDGLAGEYKDRDGNLQTVEDKGQSYRRFPFMILLHEEDFDLYINRGFIDNTDDFAEYIQYNNIRGNMQRIAERCAGNEELVRKLESKTVQPVIEKHNEVVAKFESDKADEESILKEFADYGTVGEVVESSNGFKPIDDNADLPFKA